MRHSRSATRVFIRFSFDRSLCQEEDDLPSKDRRSRRDASHSHSQSRSPSPPLRPGLKRRRSDDVSPSRSPPPPLAKKPAVALKGGLALFFSLPSLLSLSPLSLSLTHYPSFIPFFLSFTYTQTGTLCLPLSLFFYRRQYCTLATLSRVFSVLL